MIFVTGGTGFLGKNLIQELIKRGEKVRALKRSTSKVFPGDEITGQIEWVNGDVLDVLSLDEGMTGCDKVYHCAAVVDFLPKFRDTIMQVNIKGTANVVNAALDKKVKKLIHVSSVAAIGRNRNDELVNENTPWEESNLNSGYAISKFLAEREVWRGIAEGLNAVIVNPSLIFGEGSWTQGTSLFFLKIWKGLPFYPDGGSGIVSVHDVVNIIIQLMESDIHSERFIISSEHWTFKDLFFFIADHLNKKRPFIHMKPWMMEILWREEMLKSRLLGIEPLVTRETAKLASRWSRFDHSKVVKATGYEFTPMKTCLEQTAKFFLEYISKKNN